MANEPAGTSEIKVLEETAFNFSNCLRNHPEQLGDILTPGSPYREYYGTLTAQLEKTALQGLKAIVEIPGQGPISPQEYAIALVESVIRAKPTQTKNLLLAERSLNVARGTILAEIEAEIETTGLLPNAQRELKDTFSGLRQHVAHQLPNKGENIHVILARPGGKQEKPPSQEEDKIIVSAHKRIFALGGNPIVSLESDDDIEIMTGNHNTMAFVGRSSEAKEGQQESQDAAGFKKTGNRVLLVEADGVSLSFFGGIAAQTAVETTIRKESENLNSNLTSVISTLRETQNSLKTPDDIDIEMLRIALENVRKDCGSSTTYNQIAVNSETGQLNGLFVGDGGFSIVSPETTRGKHYSLQGKAAPIQISTLRGLLGGETKTMQNIVGDFRLKKGEAILLYSDGLLAHPQLLDKVCAKIKTGANNPNLRREIAQLIRNEGHLKDDLALAMYIH